MGYLPQEVCCHLLRDGYAPLTRTSARPEATQPRRQPGPCPPLGQSLFLLYPPAPTPSRTQGLPGSHQRPFISEGTRPSTKASSLMPHTTAPPGGLLTFPGGQRGLRCSQRTSWTVTHPHQHSQHDRGRARGPQVCDADAMPLPDRARRQRRGPGAPCEDGAASGPLPRAPSPLRWRLAQASRASAHQQCRAAASDAPPVTGGARVPLDLPAVGHCVPQAHPQEPCLPSPGPGPGALSPALGRNGGRPTPPQLHNQLLPPAPCQSPLRNVEPSREEEGHWPGHSPSLPGRPW